MNEDMKARYQRPEGLLIERALVGPPKRSRRNLADAVGLSEGRVRQIVNGYRTEAGQVLEIDAPDDTLARIAIELGITSQQMREAGRADVADLLDEAPNVGVTEEGDLWLASLDDEKVALAEWLDGDQAGSPPAAALALWSTEELLDAAKRSHQDQIRTTNFIITMLSNRKRGVDNGPQTATQKNWLELIRSSAVEVSEFDETMPEAADVVHTEGDEEPGGSDPNE